ncbi:glycosyl transferase [Aliidiomarina minuta]|uniref:Glycosyl transferase n=1 Tax=Aliidiomarina minuta TaxID=880057 RepID=A0A432W936_9GAMM|nr:glycosyltransferase family 2 protein [Aliidiomarina minuta]RUO26496.1 glycosyl transferase [Aliidiomarina minuta]
MSDNLTFEVQTPWYQGIQELALRLAVSKLLPLRAFYAKPPASVSGKEGKLRIEIVSHCWRYSHLHAYQLSSLVNNPPQNVEVIMTVFHAAEDEATVQLLDFFATKKVPNVRWNWQQIPAPDLFRRAIGRNQVALNTEADWVWFADCDLVFGDGCLDGLGQSLQGRDDFLVFPQQERITPLLSNDSPMLKPSKEPKVVSVNVEDFKLRTLERAVGAYQIVHGDICRDMGYCKDVSAYQRPTDRWKKTFEDRTFRWLLGTHGVPVEVPGVYRIRHIEKGRYHGNKGVTGMRKQIRKVQDSQRENS